MPEPFPLANEFTLFINSEYNILFDAELNFCDIDYWLL
ncbi:MAG: hypothetical protein JWR02_1270 [Mucilaginibacter sp.]|nr:hypothetical protein [Mucilaginibacter sp.]